MSRKADKIRRIQAESQGRNQMVLGMIDKDAMVAASSRSEVARVIERARAASMEALASPGLTHYQFGSLVYESKSGGALTIAPTANLLDDNEAQVVDTFGIDDSQRPFYDIIVTNLRCSLVGALEADTAIDATDLADAMAAINRAILTVGVKDDRHFEIPLSAILDSVYVAGVVGATQVLSQSDIDGRRGYEFPGFDALTTLDPVYLYIRDGAQANDIFTIPVTEVGSTLAWSMLFSFEGVRRD